jgi:hypothetical protein
MERERQWCSDRAPACDGRGSGFETCEGQGFSSSYKVPNDLRLVILTKDVKILLLYYTSGSIMKIMKIDSMYT